MTTTLTESFEGGTAGALVTTGTSSFTGVSTAGITFDSAHARNTLAAKVAPAAVGTRGMWWDSSVMGGNQTTLYGRLYVYFTATPPALVRLVNVQSGGSVLFGIGLNSTRQVTVRNVQAGSTPSSGTSTTVLATNTLHRIEWSAAMSASATTVVVRIYAAGNVDSTTITETLTPATMALAATTDSVMHGAAFSSAQTWSVWLDDIKMQVGTGSTWIGPTTVTPAQPDVNTGNYHLVYDMNADPKTGPRGLPSQLVPYAASQSNWGFTNSKHITSGQYADGTYYVQLKMQKYTSDPGRSVLDVWYGAGDYGCRFHYSDGGDTSIKVGRYQWTEEWTGADKVKTSMMGWFDRGAANRLPRDGGSNPAWPDAGERDLLEQWQSNHGGQATYHKGPVTVDAQGHQHHPKQVKDFPSADLSHRTTFRATFTTTRAYTEILQSDGSWRVVATWTDPAYWQPDRGYHVEGALAYSQEVSHGASTNDPGRGNATRKISNLKVWSGTDPGSGGGTSTTDTTAPSPNPSGAPTAVASTTSTGVLVTLSPCTDAGSGIDFYELQSAPDSAGSPGTPGAIVPVSELTYFDASLNQGDKVYYRQRAVDQAGNRNTFSSWTTMVTVPTVTTTLPVCIGSVAPADGSSPAGDSVTVIDGAAGVVFSAPSTVGASAILVEVRDGTGTILTINPGDGATDPNTGTVVYTFPRGARSYRPLFRASNPAGQSTDTVLVSVVAAPSNPDGGTGGVAGTVATPAPRDVWVVGQAKAYATGNLVENGLYLGLGLDQDDAAPRLVTWTTGVIYVVDAGKGGVTPVLGDGGNDPDGDNETFSDIFDNQF